MMDELDVGASVALAERHSQRVEHQIGSHTAGELRADITAAERVDHKRVSTYCNCQSLPAARSQ
jgi:hypothetical protein